MKNEYINECKTIHENCTYTAEAHHQMALSAKRKAVWLEIVPAILAAVTGSLVAAGIAPTKLILLTVVSSTVTAVAATLNPNKIYQSHLEAAKNFTTLKHDARLMCKATASRLGDEAFAVCVEGLHARYNELVKTVPPTSPKSFAKAQEVIQGGAHDPDDESLKV